MYKPQNFLMMLKACGMKVIINIRDGKVPPLGKKIRKVQVFTYATFVVAVLVPKLCPTLCVPRPFPPPGDLPLPGIKPMSSV